MAKPPSDDRKLRDRDGNVVTDRDGNVVYVRGADDKLIADAVTGPPPNTPASTAYVEPGYVEDGYVQDASVPGAELSANATFEAGLVEAVQASDELRAEVVTGLPPELRDLALDAITNIERALSYLKAVGQRNGKGENYLEAASLEPDEQAQLPEVLATLRQQLSAPVPDRAITVEAVRFLNEKSAKVGIWLIKTQLPADALGVGKDTKTEKEAAKSLVQNLGEEAAKGAARAVGSELGKAVYKQITDEEAGGRWLKTALDFFLDILKRIEFMKDWWS